MFALGYALGALERGQAVHDRDIQQLEIASLKQDNVQLQTIASARQETIDEVKAQRYLEKRRADSMLENYLMCARGHYSYVAD